MSLFLVIKCAQEKNCFSHLFSNNLHVSKVYASVSSDTDPLVVLRLLGQIGFRKGQRSGAFNPCRGGRQDTSEYQKAIGKRVGCIGPMSLFNKEIFDMEPRSWVSTPDSLC